MSEFEQVTIAGETNVLSNRFGSGSVDGIGKELGRFVVTTMDIPWLAARDRIAGSPAAVLIADSMEIDVVDRQVAAAPGCDTVLAVGGGRAIDLGKYLAWKRGCRLVTVPTVLSVDAFVTPASGIRRNHKVDYMGHASPDPLIIDYDLLRTAPAELNVAGIGDLLSIHTATFDWELAQQAGKSEFPFSPDAVKAARAILATVCERADEIARCTDIGLRAIVEGYMRVNTICLPAGHYRVEEGSEHYLFYELEEQLKRAFIHGHIVGLGVYVMSRLQDNRHEWITDVMNRVGLHYRPQQMDIPRQALADSLLSLQDYVAGNKLWHTVINERRQDRAWVDEILDCVFKA